MFGQSAPPPQPPQQAPQNGSAPQGNPSQQPQGIQHSKGKKLLEILGSGLQGALAGRAASEQAVIQSGGRRSTGAGTGFLSAINLPFQQSQMVSQAREAAANANLAEAGTQPVQTPYGNMPAALASKILTPYLGYQGKIESAKLGGQAKENVAQTQAESQQNVAQTGAQSREKVAKINQGMAIPVDETTASLAGIPELAGQAVGKGTWDNINKSLNAKGYHAQDMGANGTGPNEGTWLLDKAGNRIKQISPNSLTMQRGASFAQNRPVVVVDPNDPGNAFYASAGQAINQHLGSPQGADTVAAKSEAKSEVPTKVGDQKVAFNTAIQHAQLLTQAAQALQNGNVQALNSLGNKFSNAFGSSGPVTAQAIADAYTREVTKMLSAGHLTDAEIAAVGGTLDPNRQSPQQVVGVINAYRALAQSKLQQLNKQVETVRHPKGAPKGQTSASDPLGIR